MHFNKRHRGIVLSFISFLFLLYFLIISSAFASENIINYDEIDSFLVDNSNNNITEGFVYNSVNGNFAVEPSGYCILGDSFLIAETSGFSITVKVNKPPISKLVYITAEQTINAGQVSEVITVQAQDQFGNPTTPDAPVTISLTSTSATGRFDTSAAGPFDGTITSVVLPAGVRQVNYYYKDTRTGAHTLTSAEVPSQGWTPGQQTINIVTPGGDGSISGVLTNNNSQPYQGVTVMLLDQNGNIVIETTTGIDGSYELIAAPGTYVLSIIGIPGVSTSQATVSIVSATAINVDAHLIGPAGVLYDSTTFELVPGVTVIIREKNTGLIAYQQVTAADGSYQWFRPALPTAVTYTMEFVPPNGFIYPSSIMRPSTAPNPLPGPNPTRLNGINTGFYYVEFTFAPGFGSGDLLENDIPVDRPNLQLLKVRKVSNRKDIRRGELLIYMITVENPNDFPVNGFYLEDTLPPGFRYVKNSTIRDGQIIGDPSGSNTLVIRYGPFNIAANGSFDVSYQTVPGARVKLGGEYKNTALARTRFGGPLSLVSQAVVRIVADPLFDESTIIGRVYIDLNNNKMYDPGEPGVANCDLYTEDGIHVTTDSEGLYHLEGLKADQAKVVKLDEVSLPDGYHVVTENPYLVKLTAGIIVKVNFGVSKE